jgi:hypothetical protein
MTALPSPDFQPPVRTKAFSKKRRRLTVLPTRKSKLVYQQKVLATTGKLVVYSLLFALGIVSLVKMVNYNLTQQSKLHLLRSEVKDAKQRMQIVDESFQRSFDPHMAKELMQESSYKIAPDQKPIKVYTPDGRGDR